jgi:predicted NACHT family NTPase
MATTEEEWGDKVPFFIRLREFAGKPLPAPETFPSLVAEAVAGTMPNAWVHQHLQEGRAVVLIDGLDEVPESQYDAVKEWVGDLVAAFPHARFIVTSRPHAAEEDWLDDHDFCDAELQGTDPDDIEKFLAH